MGAVRYLSDQVVVLYLGRVMEQGTTEAVFGPPYHPYTEALLSAVPVADPAVEKRRIVLDGPLPSALDTLQGCPFATRCPRRIGAVCDTVAPPDRDFGEGHHIACHLPVEALQAVEPVITVKAATP